MHTTQQQQETVTTVQDLLDALGGASHVRARLGVTKPNTSNWRRQGKIPARHYRSICQLRDEQRENGGRFVTFPDELFSFDDLRPAPEGGSVDEQAAAG